MTKRLVEIDDDTLAGARRALGTTTITDTVRAALEQPIEGDRRRAVTREDLVRVGESLEDLRDPEVMSGGVALSAARWLVDTSAISRLHHPKVADVLHRLMAAGLLGVRLVTELEVGYSAAPPTTSGSSGRTC